MISQKDIFLIFHRKLELKSEWKYNREKFLVKTAAGILITGSDASILI